MPTISIPDAAPRSAQYVRAAVNAFLPHSRFGHQSLNSLIAAPKITALLSLSNQCFNTLAISRLIATRATISTRLRLFDIDRSAAILPSSVSSLISVGLLLLGFSMLFRTGFCDFLNFHFIFLFHCNFVFK